MKNTRQGRRSTRSAAKNYKINEKKWTKPINKKKKVQKKVVVVLRKPTPSKAVKVEKPKSPPRKIVIEKKRLKKSLFVKAVNDSPVLPSKEKGFLAKQKWFDGKPSNYDILIEE